MSSGLEQRVRRLVAAPGLSLTRRGTGRRWVLSDPRRPGAPALLVTDYLDEVEDVLVDSLADGNPGRLLGRPFYETSEMVQPGATAGANNDPCLIFGDTKQHVVVDRIGTTVELVPHVFGPNQRPTGQRGFYLFWRSGSDTAAPDAMRVLRA